MRSLFQLKSSPTVFLGIISMQMSLQPFARLDDSVSVSVACGKAGSEFPNLAAGAVRNTDGV